MDPDNVIDFGKARLRKQASEAGKVDPPTPEVSDDPMSHEDICEWIKEYILPEENTDPEGES